MHFWMKLSVEYVDPDSLTFLLELAFCIREIEIEARVQVINDDITLQLVFCEGDAISSLSNEGQAQSTGRLASDYTKYSYHRQTPPCKSFHWKSSIVPRVYPSKHHRSSAYMHFGSNPPFVPLIGPGRPGRR